MGSYDFGYLLQTSRFFSQTYRFLFNIKITVLTIVMETYAKFVIFVTEINDKHFLSNTKLSINTKTFS